MSETNTQYHNDSPLVSVIIPHWNHKEFIEERFHSVIQQTYQNYEIILLDDASDDGSITILQRLAEHEKVSHFVANTSRSGSAFKQWKRGIDLARGEFIWIAESDDSCEPQFLDLLVNKLCGNKDLVLAYCQSWDVDLNGGRLENRVYWTSNFSPNIWHDDFECNGHLFIQKYLGVKNVLPNASAVVFRKDAVDPTCWDTMLKMFFVGDWFFWCKLLLKGDVAFVRDSCNYFRMHGATTRMQNSFDREIKRLIENADLRIWLKQEIDSAQKYKYKGLKRKLVHLIRREVKYGSPVLIFSSSLYRLILKLIRLRFF